jgi:phosphate transport system substrate-binding protein
MAADKITGAGASFPASLYYDWAHTYNEATGTQVNYQSIGSGGGIKQIKSRIVNYGASDKPLKPEELSKLDKKRKGLYQFPAVVGSIVLAYNIPGVKDGEIKLSNKNVADIFLGKIKYWNDKRLKADNPDVALPEKRITVVRRSDGSGTTYNFTYYLSQISKLWKDEIYYGKSVDWPVGIGGKGNEGVTNLLKQTPYSLGYIEYSYKQRMGLDAATLQSSEGNWVEATMESFQAAAAYAKWTKEEHFYQMLTLQPGKNSYPIVAATFILLPKGDRFESMNRKVTAFYDHAFKNGDSRASELGYVPLPKATKDMIRSYWKDNGVNPQ